MNVVTTVALALLASGGLWAVLQGVLKARTDRRTQAQTDSRADRTDVVGISEKNAAFWREQWVLERQRVDALQAQLFELRVQAEHSADIAQAGLLAYQQAKRAKREQEPV